MPPLTFKMRDDVKRVTVKAGQRYEVLIGHALFETAPSVLRCVSEAQSLLLVSDDTVFPLYGERVERGFAEAGFAVARCVLPHGEAHKNMTSYGAILAAAADFGLTRGDAMVSLGGGMVGDLTGFAAATYMRGIGYMLLPTTLLSSVDAAVGGKTGLNLPQGKNLAGAFWQPLAVLCESDVLSALPSALLSEGMAEVIKYGVIRDERILTMAERGVTSQIPAELVARCVAIKSDIVSRDERDSGARRLLNFGHTVAHAVEAESAFTLGHGRSVAIGMVCETRMAERLGLCPAGLSQRLDACLRRYGLPTSLPDMAPGALVARMGHDKKNRGGTITFVLPLRCGACVIKELTAQEVLSLLS